MADISEDSTDKPVENLIVKLPTQMKRDYQKKCIDKGMKMRHEIIDHIKEFLKSESP